MDSPVPFSAPNPSPKFLLIIGRGDKCLCFPLDVLDDISIHGFMPLDDEPISSLADCVKNLELGNSKAREVVVVLQGNGELEILDVTTKEYEGTTSTSSTSWPGVLDVDNSFSESYKRCSIGESLNTNELLAAVLQENENSHPVAVEINLSNWSTMWIRTESQGYQLLFQFVNWELNGIFNYPHKPQDVDLCWLFTLCDHLQTLYAQLHPKEPPIKLSKQYLLDYLPPNETVDIGDPFGGYNLERAYRWAEKHYLVLEENYSPYEGIRGTQKPVGIGKRLRIVQVNRLEGYEEEKIERALLDYPLVGTIFLRPDDTDRFDEDKCFSYVIENENGEHGMIEEMEEAQEGGRHSIILSGTISSQFSHPKLAKDPFFVKDTGFLTLSGRFFLKKEPYVLSTELNALIYVLYPETVYLES